MSDNSNEFTKRQYELMKTATRLESIDYLIELLDRAKSDGDLDIEVIVKKKKKKEKYEFSINN